MSDIDIILARDVDDEELQTVMGELDNLCGPPTQNSPNKYMNLDRIIKKQREKITSYRNGKPFLCPFHINASVDTQSYYDTYVEYDKFMQEGCGYMVSDKIYHDTTKQQWVSDKPQECDASIMVNTIDKIKVRSIFLSSANISRQYCLTGSSGVNNKNNNKNCDMFLQEVSDCRSPTATWARYRRVENSLSIAVSPNDVCVNTINVNMPKGVHEHIVLQRIIAVHLTSNNPKGARVVPLTEWHQTNNNSITLDTLFSAVTNSISFPNNQKRDNQGFKILPKAEFRTSKLIIPCDKDDFSTYHKNTDVRQSYPVKGVEIQVHPRCVNCSAIAGTQLLVIIKPVLVDLLNMGSSGGIIIDICLVNAKAICERLSHSLISPTMNDFCEILCRRLGTYTMNTHDQMKVFKNTVRPILRKIFMSRDNYALCGPFASSVPQGCRLLSINDTELISHKYKNTETEQLFYTFHVDELKNIGLSDFMEKVKQYKQTKQTQLNSVGKTKKKKDLKRKRQRTAGIVHNTSLYQRRYICALQKYNIDLPTPAEV